MRFSRQKKRNDSFLTVSLPSLYDSHMFLTSIDDRTICPHQIAQILDNGENPYRLYVLPLAREQIGLLYSVLALSACHLGHLVSDNHLYGSVSVEYRVKAITELGISIRQIGTGQFTENDRDAVFATIQILLLHDVRPLHNFSRLNTNRI